MTTFLDPDFREAGNAVRLNSAQGWRRCRDPREDAEWGDDERGIDALAEGPPQAKRRDRPGGIPSGKI